MCKLFHGWSLNRAAHQEAAAIGQYLGGELDWLGEGELGRRSRNRDTLGSLFLCALSLGLRLGLLPCLSHLLLLLLLLGLVICCCGCLSLLIGLGSCMGSVSGMGCV